MSTILPRKGSARRKRLRRETSEGAHPADDPATPRVRRAMMRRLVVQAIRRYEETLASTRWFDACYPLLSLPVHPTIAIDVEDRQAWRRLAGQVDADFDNAELSLAMRIQILYDDLAPEGRKTGTGEHGHFVERAIRFEGTTYALQYNVEDYEPGSNIVAIVREGRSFDLVKLDAEGQGP